MPIYEYVCENCGNIFSLLQRMSIGEGETECPACKSFQVKRQISACAIGGAMTGNSGSSGG